MALQSIKHGFPFPAWPTDPSGAPSLSGITLDASGEKAALIFAASAAKAIRKIHFRTTTVTLGDTLDCRVETVDTAANGDPTGTLHTANSNGACVVDIADDNVWKSATLTADTAALAIGNVVALVLVNGGVGNMLIATYVDQVCSSPYGDLFTASWAKQTTMVMIVPEYSDGSFEPIFGYFDNGGPVTSTTYNSGTAANRRGNIFQVPFPTRAKGCWAWVDADGDYTVKLYDSDGSTVLATTATVNNFQRTGTVGAIQFFPFTTTATLSAGTNYRLAVVPSSVTSLTTYEFDVPAAGMLDMFPGGQACHASVYTSGTWGETTTRRGYLGVFLDAFSDGSGGGHIIGGGF